MAKFKEIVRNGGGTTTDQPHLPLSMLEPNPDNIRLDTDDLRAHIRGIADSIIETGYLRSRPLTVRFVGEKAVVVDGNCRLAACRIAAAEGAELATIPCVLEAPGTTAVERLANMVIANSGLAHSPIEMTAVIKKLLSYGWSDSAIAKRLGKSRQYVANLIDLAAAPEDVREAITNGTISATQALTVMKTEGDNAGAVIAAVAAKAKAEGKARVTAKAFKTPSGAVKGTTPPAKPEAPSRPGSDLNCAAREVLRLWDGGDLGAEFDEAIRALREAVG